MANINASIKTGSGFLLKNAPLDLKLTAATIAERNTYIALGNNVLYKGAVVYVEEDNTFYVFNGTDPTGEDYSACWDRLIPSDIEGGNFPTLDGENHFTGDVSFDQAPTVGGETVATTNDVGESITDAIGDTVQAHSDKLDDVAALSAGLLDFVFSVGQVLLKYIKEFFRAKVDKSHTQKYENDNQQQRPQVLYGGEDNKQYYRNADDDILLHNYKDFKFLITALIEA